MRMLSRALPGVLSSSIVLGMLLASSLFAQEETAPQEQAAPQEDAAPSDEAAPAKTAQQLVNDAYAKTSAAQTADDFTEIISLCDQIEQADGATRQFIDYAKKLRSWARNRRGESFSDEAAKMRAQGEGAEAERLENAAMSDFEASLKEDSSRWKAIHNRGVNHAMKGNFEAAIKDFSQVVSIRPGYANAWFNRGEIRYEQRQFREAIQDYNQALRLTPDDPGCYTSRAHAYFQLRDGQRALSDYSKAIELDKTNSLYYANRADCNQSLGRWENAAADYRQAIRLNDKLGRAYQGAAWLMATCPDSRFRDADLAVQSAQKAISLDGESDYQYLDTLAAAYANAGQFDQAQEAIAQAIANAPEAQKARLVARQGLFAKNQPYRQSTGNARTANR